MDDLRAFKDARIGLCFVSVGTLASYLQSYFR